MDSFVIKKQWFIKSQTAKIEDYYEFDQKKVPSLVIPL